METKLPKEQNIQMLKKHTHMNIYIQLEFRTNLNESSHQFSISIIANKITKKHKVDYQMNSNPRTVTNTPPN